MMMWPGRSASRSRSNSDLRRRAALLRARPYRPLRSLGLAQLQGQGNDRHSDVAALVYVYDHEERDLAKRLTKSSHGSSLSPGALNGSRAPGGYQPSKVRTGLFAGGKRILTIGPSFFQPGRQAEERGAEVLDTLAVLAAEIDVASRRQAVVEEPPSIVPSSDRPGGNRIRTIGPAEGARHPRRVGSRSRRASVGGQSGRSDVSRSRNLGRVTRNRWFESGSLQRRDGMGQATRRWHHRRCSQLMECPDAPA
jgi:hypothetical protein